MCVAAFVVKVRSFFCTCLKKDTRRTRVFCECLLKREYKKKQTVEIYSGDEASRQLIIIIINDTQQLSVSKHSRYYDYS